MFPPGLAIPRYSVGPEGVLAARGEGFNVEGSGFQVKGSGFSSCRVLGLDLGLWASGSGFIGLGLRAWVLSSGFQVLESGFRL